MSFATASQVLHRDGPLWVGEVEPGWDIAGVTNGGYLMAMVGRAMGDLSPHLHLVSMSAHFTRPAGAGQVTIEVEQVRAGRGFSTFRAEMLREGQTLLSALGTFAAPDREIADAELTKVIIEIHAWSRRSYGSPQIHQELRQGRGIRCGRKRVERLMRGACLQGSYRRKGQPTKPLPPTHDDLVARQRRVANRNDRLLEELAIEAAKSVLEPRGIEDDRRPQIVE